jgi:hypothetical protein
VEHIFEAVHGPTVTHFDGDSSSSAMSMSGNRRHSGYYNFLLRNTSAAHQREDLHPLPSQMLFLWQTYVDNVDPFMKVLHVPTMTKIIRELRGSYHSLRPSIHALVLVISLAAIMSLDPEEVSSPNLKLDMVIWLIYLAKGLCELRHRQRPTRCSLSTWR